MRSVARGLMARYRAHHDMNRSYLEWVGVVGVIAFPFFYLMRFTGKLPPRYDDLELRLVAVGICLLLAVRKWWPARVKALYLPFSYFALTYCLSFLLTFTLLQNNSATNTVVNMAVGAVLIILLADWRNAIIVLLSGYGIGFVAYWYSHPAPRLPVEFLSWWIPLGGLLIAGGALSKFGEKQAEFRRMRLLYTGLADAIAHELRVPMQRMQDAIDTLEQDFLRTGRPQGQGVYSVEQAMAIARGVQEGRSGVKLGLQSVTTTLRQLNTRDFDVRNFTGLSAATCAERAVRDFAYESETQRERVRFEEMADFTFKGGETVLSLILFNLLKNALRHLPAYPDSTVTVTVDARRIAVVDCGPGIEPERMAHLFDDFRRSGRAEGTTLSFCQRAMQALGGEITCESQPGKFTAFTLAFPEMSRAEAETQDAAVTRCAGDLLQACRVLVVGDDPLQRRAMCEKLMALNNASHIDEARNDAEAMEMLTWLMPYDLVLTDLDAPGLGDHGFVQQMRLGGVPRHGLVPVLAHSAAPATEARSKARRAGMHGFLRTPFTMPELARAVTALLKGSSVRGGPIDPAPFAGQTALLADANDANRAIVKGQLEGLGISVMEARQEADVLKCMKAGARPAVIVMNMDMPAVDGIETTRQMRLMGEAVRNIPVLALTDSTSEARKKAAEMDGFLTHPVHVAALRRELGRLLKPCPVAGGLTLKASQAAAVDESLLDLARVSELRQMDIMLNMVPEGLTNTRRLAKALDEAFLHHDLRAGQLALHELIVLSGTMGGHAVYEAALQHAHSLENGVWPSEAGWLERLKALMVQSERALLVSYGLGRVQL